MPQIAQLAETFSSQVFWVLIIFGLVFFVVGKGMVPKVMDTVAQRDKQIADDLAAAQASRDQADDQEASWRKRENENRAQAQALIASAKADAATQAEGRLAQAQQGIDARLTEAEQRIAAARAEAAAEIETVAADAARAIVQKVSRLDVAPAAAQAAVKEALVHG